MAIKDMLMFLNEGYEWIVDIDLEKFFDNVPQDKLMSLVHNIINGGDTGIADTEISESRSHGAGQV